VDCQSGTKPGASSATVRAFRGSVVKTRCFGHSLLDGFHYPVQAGNFPVLSSREFTGNPLNFHRKGEARIAVLGLRRQNFPVFSRETGEDKAGERFADDCLHRQLVFCFCREISLSEIIAEVPQVKPRQSLASDHRERSLENGGARWAPNSLSGNLAVRLGRC
jgi:hypothetical protein